MPVTEAPPKPPAEELTLRRDLPQDPAELHFLIVMAIIIQPKFFPNLFATNEKVVLVTPELNDRDVRFLALPQDSQKPVPPPKSNIISDKNRIAQARRPTIDRHTLEELQNARRRGVPGPRAMQA